MQLAIEHPTFVPLVPEVHSDRMIENMRVNLARGLPELRRMKPHTETISIASGGPSLKSTWRDIRGHVGAVNGSLSFLLEQGVIPHFCAVMDSHPRLTDIVAAHPDVNYLIASNCDPSLFDKLLDAGCRVWIWHATPDSLGSYEGVAMLQARSPDPLMIGGGCTIGLRWMSLAYVMGYRKMVLHGLDSSFADGNTHAYADRRSVDDAIEINGFRTSPNFLAQVQSFGQILDRYTMDDLENVTLDVVGHGLLQSCYHTWGGSGSATRCFGYLMGTTSPSVIAADNRSASILRRLPDGPVRGAEVGVFGGALSARLLSRPDLQLTMIDSWEGDGAAYADGNDWHATLSQDQQDRYYWAAVSATAGASDRREIIKARSLDAAKQIADASLDFVFLDADHSAHAVAADISAWLPKVKPGGLICGHDYGHALFPGVKLAVDAFALASGAKIETGGDYTWFARCK